MNGIPCWDWPEMGRVESWRSGKALSPAPPRQSVHSVFPNTAFRSSSSKGFRSLSPGCRRRYCSSSGWQGYLFQGRFGCGGALCGAKSGSGGNCQDRLGVSLVEGKGLSKWERLTGRDLQKEKPGRPLGGVRN